MSLLRFLACRLLALAFLPVAVFLCVAFATALFGSAWLAVGAGSLWDTECRLTERATGG